jgi:PAS domain S-box-containing protein
MSDHEQSRDHRPHDRVVRGALRARPEGAGNGAAAPPHAAGLILDLLDTIGDSLFVLDRDWRFVYLSPNSLRQAGVPEGELLGRVLWEKYPELLGTPFEAHYRRAVAERRMIHFEAPGVRSGRWYEVYAAPLPDGLAVYSRDIAGRKQAEEALRESEERHRAIAELTSDYTYACRLEPDGTAILESASAGFRDVTGFTVEEVQARGGWLVLIHPDDRPRAQEGIGPLLLSGRGDAFELRIVTKQGATRWIRFSGRVVGELGPGRAARLVGAVQDVTERKAAEEALRESEERLRRFFEATVEGIAIHEDGVIVDANQSLADMFGYPLAELLGRHILDLAAPESRDEVRRHLLAGDERPYEATGRRRDGSTFPGEIRGKTITHRGRTARVAVLRDITRRKQAKEKLREYAQRLQGLSRRLLEVQEQERRHLARELHDEIGQVLTGLRLTLERNRRLPADELRASLAETQEFVRELTAQVRDLSLRLRPTMLDDFGLLAALLWHFERYTAQTGVRVSVEHRGLERRLAPEVETAGYRIIQEALTNVARHAGVAACVARVWLDKGVLYLQVEDGGRGFDAERVLRRDRSTGLSGMQERVELLGGRFTVESGPGQGTRLLAELPVQVSAGRKPEGPEPRAGP